MRRIIELLKEYQGITAFISAISTMSALWFVFSNKPPGIALWEVLKVFPIGIIWAALSTVVACLTLYFAVTRPQFYQNRAELDAGTHGLKNELGRASEFWVMWPAGHAVGDMDAGLQPIKRLILGTPNDDLHNLERHADYFGSTNAEHVKQVIMQTTARAKANNVPVRWNRERTFSMIIADPNGTAKNGWIRIEFIMPFLPGASRPSFVVRQRWHPQLFSEIARAFNKTWDKSIMPT